MKGNTLIQHGQFYFIYLFKKKIFLSMDNFSTADYVSIFVDLSLKILREDKKCPGSLHIIKW